MNEQKD